MSATGSVNLIVCFSLSHPFAPRLAENLQQLVHHSFVVSRLSLDSSLIVANANDQRLTTLHHDDFETPGISPRNAN
jgi:hypothetical protein